MSGSNSARADRFPPERCGPKVSYRSRVQAEGAAKVARRRHPHEAYHAYRHEKCGRWHVGSAENAQRVRRVRARTVRERVEGDHPEALE